MVYYSHRRKVNKNSDIKAQKLKRMSPVQFDFQYQEQALYTYPERERICKGKRKSIAKLRSKRTHFHKVNLKHKGFALSRKADRSLILILKMFIKFTGIESKVQI